MAWRRLLVAAAVGAAIVYASTRGESEAERLMCGENTVRLEGRVVDAATGEPVAAAVVQVFFSRDRADDAKPFDDSRFEPRVSTEGDGSFVVPAARCTSRTERAGRRSPTRHAGAAALSVEADGFARKVVDCANGTWTRANALLDMGEIRLARR